MFKASINQFTNWLFEPTCLLCNRPSRCNKDLCLACEEELPWLSAACIQCAQPLMSVNESSKNYCGSCLNDSPPYNKTFALFTYQPPIDYVISQFKFHQQLTYGRLLSDLLCARIHDHWYKNAKLPECIIPMPLHPKRLCERGYNQALEISRSLGKSLKLPVDFTSCVRTRHTAAQSSLPAKVRSQNVKNAFQVVKPLPYKHIAILDDVITTGHTVRELSLALRNTGIEIIDVWSCVRVAG